MRYLCPFLTCCHFHILLFFSAFQLCPKFLHTNSTSHTWPFSAVAELIDNAYDPDVNAKQIWIDKTVIKGYMCLTVTDNGNGMNHDKLHKMLSFGFSDKVAINGHVPVGLYGNGFKSGSMRLGRDAIVFTKNDCGMHVGMLSQTYLEAIQAEHVVVPLVSFNKHNILYEYPDSSCRTTKSILTIQLDFDFDNDKYDIRIPEEVDGMQKRGYKRQERTEQVAPDSDFSLRAYCSILYLKPRMQIVIRGQKVQTQLVSKSLALIEKDVYRPKFLAPKTVKITFGYNCRNKEHYGIMMYHRNRLIKAYVRVGCQLKANNMGVGVVGVIECNFLKPTHNKQDFDYTNDYRLTLHALGEKLNDYWNEMKMKKNMNPQSLPVEDTKKTPDQRWVQCDSCLKWRKLPDSMGNLPDKWYCRMNLDPQFRDCNVPEEPEDDDEITHSTYEKTYKRSELFLILCFCYLLQAFEKTTILFTPTNLDLQPALNPIQRLFNKTRMPGQSLKRLHSAESMSSAAKKPRPAFEVESIDFSDVDEPEDGDVIILEANSTPKPKSENEVHSSCHSPVPLESFEANSPNTVRTNETAAAATQTDRRTLTIKKEEEEDPINDLAHQENHSIYSHCNGTELHTHAMDHESEHYRRRCELLEQAVQQLQDELQEIKNKNVKTEVSNQFTQTEPGTPCEPANSSRQLVTQYEQALKEVNRLKVQCDTLQQLKSEQDTRLERGVKDSSDLEDMAAQLEGVVIQLDACTTELEERKCQKEKAMLETEIKQLKVMIQQMNDKETASTSTSTVEEERTLRVNVAQLLTTLMPELDLQQINYDVDVIDEILMQVLDQTERQASEHK
uniref:MORC family CW-type zinc finger 3 n=1 Tax=Leptobrachium leishanense TaxID=445787 RepID=A0A8C5PB05_9ANUR